MQFEIESFASKFQDTLGWMLENQHAGKIKEDLYGYQKAKQELLSVTYPEGILKLLVETKITNGYYRKLSELKKKSFDADFGDFFEKHGQNFIELAARRPEGKAK